MKRFVNKLPVAVVFQLMVLQRKRKEPFQPSIFLKSHIIYFDSLVSMVEIGEIYTTTATKHDERKNIVSCFTWALVH